MKLETRAVLAGAYKATNPKSCLTHSVLVDESGNEQQVLCKGPKLEHIADPYAGPTDEPPTCPRCQNALMKAVKAPMLKKVNEVKP